MVVAAWLNVAAHQCVLLGQAAGHGMLAIPPDPLAPAVQVTPVTLITTDYALHHYRQNAVSAAYICYGLKQGHVRVLARSSAVRALLKGHTKPLTDLQARLRQGWGGVEKNSHLAPH